MKENKYFVYRLMFNEQTIYVGSTEDIEARTYAHSTSGVKFDSVLHTTTKDKESMLQVEYSLIDEYKPPYNKLMHHEVVIPLTFEDLKWTLLNIKSSNVNQKMGGRTINTLSEIPSDFNISINDLSGNIMSTVKPSDFSLADRLTFLLIKCCYDKYGRFTVNQQLLSEALNVNHKTITRCVSRLRDLGVITTSKGFRSQITYEVTSK